MFHHVLLQLRPRHPLPAHVETRVRDQTALSRRIHGPVQDLDAPTACPSALVTEAQCTSSMIV